jgi:hypothetical protein
MSECCVFVWSGTVDKNFSFNSQFYSKRCIYYHDATYKIKVILCAVVLKQALNTVSLSVQIIQILK